MWACRKTERHDLRILCYCALCKDALTDSGIESSNTMATYKHGDFFLTLPFIFKSLFSFSSLLNSFSLPAFHLRFFLSSSYYFSPPLILTSFLLLMFSSNSFSFLCSHFSPFASSYISPRYLLLLLLLPSLLPHLQILLHVLPSSTPSTQFLLPLLLLFLLFFPLSLFVFLHFSFFTSWPARLSFWNLKELKQTITHVPTTAMVQHR